MAYPNTGSNFTTDDGLNRTGTSVSTNIVIQVDGNPVGAVRSLSITEQRKIKQIDEVGTDGHIDSVPMSSVDVSGTCERVRYDNIRIMPALSRGFIHLASQRIPFDIVIIDRFAGNDTDDSQNLITTIKNVWANNIKYDYKSDDFVIIDTMQWEAEYIYSKYGSGGNAVPGVAGSRNLSIITNPIEMAADRGDRRGALDAAGLLFAVQGSQT